MKDTKDTNHLTVDFLGKRLAISNACKPMNKRIKNKQIPNGK